MNAAISIIANAVVLGLMIFGLEFKEVNPRVLLFAYVLAYVFKLVTIETLILLYEERIARGLSPITESLSSPPPPGMKSIPLGTDSGKPVTLGGYLGLTLNFGFFIFLLSHVNKHHALDFEFPVFVREMIWAVVVALIYWTGDILSRSLIIDFDAPRHVNYGYNCSELYLLAASLAFGTGVVVFCQITGRDILPVFIYLPLIGVKLFADLRTLRKRAVGSG